MPIISEIVPDPDVFLALSPEEIAGVILEHLHSLPPGEQRWLNRRNYSMKYTFNGYPEEKVEPCMQVVVEGWAVLESLGLLVPQPGGDASNFIFSRRGREIRSRTELASFRHASLFPKDLVHPKILEKVYPLFLRGDYETSVFQSYKLVEIAVRNAASDLDAKLYGSDLMMQAFNPDTGPLTYQEEPAAERKSLQFLFVGAVGRFKNPSSHRHLSFDDPREAIELIQFASHLLRVVESRAKVGN